MFREMIENTLNDNILFGYNVDILKVSFINKFSLLNINHL